MQAEHKAAVLEAATDVPRLTERLAALQRQGSKRLVDAACWECPYWERRRSPPLATLASWGWHAAGTGVALRTLEERPCPSAPT